MNKEVVQDDKGREEAASIEAVIADIDKAKDIVTWQDKALE